MAAKKLATAAKINSTCNINVLAATAIFFRAEAHLWRAC